MTSPPLRLGVNVDHVATVRNARGGPRPDPVRAALLAIDAGADGVTAHLREDRRHINDADMARLKAAISKPLNFEMAATEQMLDIAVATAPHAVCLVPEKRTERTTEGGLDVVGQHDYLMPYVDQLTREGVRVSLFIEPSAEALDAAVSVKAPVVELHTAPGATRVEVGDMGRAEAEFARVAEAAAYGAALGLEIHAGHGLDYETARRVSDACRRSLNSTSAIFSSARRYSSGSRRRSGGCGRRWSRAGRKPSRTKARPGRRITSAGAALALIPNAGGDALAERAKVAGGHPFDAGPGLFFRSGEGSHGSFSVCKPGGRAGRRRPNS